jgi:hypothetical protein
MAKIDYNEVGTNGLNEMSGFIHAAYASELTWPSCQPLYSRLRRSDPEISTIRQVFQALTRAVSIDWELPDKPNDADKKAQEFAQQVIDDVEGGDSAFLETVVSHVPFYGWGWFDVVPGVRDPNWKPPDPEDDWRSEYKDGNVGIRRLAFRDTSSFQGWDLTDRGRLRGMVQMDYPNPTVILPLSHGLHIAYGDTNNPEGLSPLEAVWRMERIKFGLEVIQGIGFEHSAGYLEVTSENALTPADKAEIQRSARAIMSAQEGNYAAWPKGVRGELKDSAFQAAAAILESIRYYGLIKLQVYLSQWVAIASTAGTGAYSAASDASSMFMMIFNGMMKGFAKQADAQIGKRLFQWNSFPGMTKRPRLIITPIEKTISLTELGQIITPLKNVLPLGPDDFISIRRKTGFLPESLPDVDETPQPEEKPAPDNSGDNNPDGDATGDNQVDGEDTGDGSDPSPDESKQAEATAERRRYWQGVLLHHPELLSKGAK